MKFKIGFFWALKSWPRPPAIQVFLKAPKFQEVTLYLQQKNLRYVAHSSGYAAIFF